MLRKLSFSVVVVLLLSSGALADIGHAQDFAINASNLVARNGYVGSAKGSNTAMVGHAQKAYSVASGTAAYQKETAILIQSGRTVGLGGKTAIVQEATVDGAQNQLVGSGFHGRGIRTESQSLSVNLNSLTSNIKGIGGAVAAQSFVGAQTQIEVTPNGMSASSQYVGVTQFSAVSGTHSTVKNNVDVVLNQNQDVAGK